MSLRDKVEGYRKKLISIQRTEQLLVSLTESLDGVTVTDPTNISTQGGELTDRLPFKLQRIADIKKDIALNQSLIDGQREEIGAILGALPGDMEGFVLKSYYMWLIDHQEIAEQLYGHNADWGHYNKRQSYLAQVRKLKSSGLKNLEQMNTIPMRLGV